MLAFCICLILALVTVGRVQAAEGVTLVTGDDYPPITSQKLKYGGLGVRIVMRAFELADYPVADLKWQPWARGYTLTQKGTIDGAFPWGPTLERSAFFYFTDPIMEMRNLIYVASGSSLSISTEEDLKGLVYCNPNGYGDFGVVKRYRKAGLLKRHEPLNMTACFKMLAEGRVDLVVAPIWDAEHAIKSSGEKTERFRQEELSVPPVPLALLITRKNKKGPEIVAAFNRGLAELKKTGEFERIYREFNFYQYLN